MKPTINFSSQAYTSQALKWEYRFLIMADLVATWSKDPSTQVGAVIADSKNRVVSLGFNGLPQGLPDDPQYLNDRSLKYQMVIHAEENALLFAARSVEGCSIYISHPPCSSCAAKIIQSGISRVVYTAPSGSYLERWAASYNLATHMYKKAGVKRVEIS